MSDVKVGGQALPDGVVMRTQRAWAVARADGSVETGEIPPSPFERIPVLRVLAGVILGLRIGFRRRRSSAARGRRRPPTMTRLIVSLLATELAVVALDGAAGRLGLPRWGSPITAAVICVIALFVFRLVAPSAQWSYHGAEHKAVTAYEAGCDVNDVDAVRTYSRLHPRCGTNLVPWVAVGLPLLQRFPGPVQLLLFPLLLGGIAELVSLAARRPSSLLSRAIVAPGTLIQAAVTTAEPTWAQQRIGCLALSACLERHRACVTASSDAPHEKHDQDDDEDQYDGANAYVHGAPVPAGRRS
jgi:uncharacterized protein YqhQ